jgi:hypothetical protein
MLMTAIRFRLGRLPSNCETISLIESSRGELASLGDRSQRLSSTQKTSGVSLDSQSGSLRSPLSTSRKVRRRASASTNTVHQIRPVTIQEMMAPKVHEVVSI